MPAIVAVAALVVLVPPLAFGQPWDTWVYRGLALLLIGCPCALVISVPASIASAMSTGARRGLLMKGGAVIEAAAKVNRIAFDKTGTLTHGRPKVTDVVLFGSTTEAELLAVACEIMRACGLGPDDVVARVSDRRLLTALVRGAGVLAGGPYYCAEGSTWRALSRCMSPSSWAPLPTVAALRTGAEAIARAGRIDPLEHLRDDRRRHAHRAHRGARVADGRTRGQQPEPRPPHLPAPEPP